MQVSRQNAAGEPLKHTLAYVRMYSQNSLTIVILNGDWINQSFAHQLLVTNEKHVANNRGWLIVGDVVQDWTTLPLFTWWEPQMTCFDISPWLKQPNYADLRIWSLSHHSQALLTYIQNTFNDFTVSPLGAQLKAMGQLPTEGPPPSAADLLTVPSTFFDVDLKKATAATTTARRAVNLVVLARFNEYWTMTYDDNNWGTSRSTRV